MRPRVTLSFDNGPEPGWTERVLDTLGERGLTATFFMIAGKLDDPVRWRLADRVKAEGHRIGNHTLSHSEAFGERRDTAFAAREIEEAQAKLGALADENRFFRPFGNDGLLGPHLLSEAALGMLLDNAYTTVVWNSVPGDWKDPDGWVERGIGQISSSLHNVVVLHDIENASATRLSEYIRRLDDLGAQWTTDFPESVILTRAGQQVSLPDEYVAERFRR